MATSCTRAEIPGSTVLRPFITRETVARETPAALATSAIVTAGRRVFASGIVASVLASRADHAWITF
ncbi:hypothetical protein GCM10009718_10300 [Isoptericola halotolerans]